MALTETQQVMAHALERARRERRPIESFQPRFPDVTIAEAYQIQAYVASRQESLGNPVVGYKMGMTSLAKQRSIGLTSPVYGRLFREGVSQSGEPLRRDGLIHPRVEPEIGLVLGRSLTGPGVSAHQVIRNTVSVVACLEILDSRYQDFKFSITDVIADNTSESRVYVGNKICSAQDFDWGTEGIVLQKNGATVQCGAGAAVLGHPANAIAMLANLLAEDGESVPPGVLLLTGGITEAVPVELGDHIVCRWQHLGEIQFMCM